MKDFLRGVRDVLPILFIMTIITGVIIVIGVALSEKNTLVEYCLDRDMVAVSIDNVGFRCVDPKNLVKVTQ